MGRTQLKAHKLPSGNYRVQVYLGKDENGKRIMISFTDPDEKHALALATQYQDEHRNAQEQGSFGAAMDAYISARKPVLSPATIKSYQEYQRTLKNDYSTFCAKNIHTIKAADVQKVINSLLEVHDSRHRFRRSPQALSTKSIRNYAGFISSVFRHNGILPPAVKLPEKEQPKINVPDDDTMKKLFEAVKGKELEVPVLLAAFGPLRRGEICALTMHDIKGNVIHVSKDMVKDLAQNWTTKRPKTFSSDRFVEMPPRVIKLIKKQGYVTKLTPDAISDQFRVLLDSEGLPHFRFHDLRHWCASYLHSQGMSDVSIMKRGGWSTDSTLKSVYRHVLADQDKKQTELAIEKFNSFFDISCEYSCE